MSQSVKQQALMNLRSVLADLYNDQASQRRIVADAGLQVSSINFEDTATNVWHAILEHARKREKIGSILAVVVAEGEYDTNLGFLRAELSWLLSQEESSAAALGDFYNENREKYKLPSTAEPLDMLKNLQESSYSSEKHSLLEIFVVQLIAQSPKSVTVERLPKWLARVFPESHQKKQSSQLAKTLASQFPDNQNLPPPRAKQPAKRTRLDKISSNLHTSPMQTPPPVVEVSDYPDLVRSLLGNTTCAFVGAGLSMGAGLPDWYSLIEELTKPLGHKLPPREWVTSDALIDAAQFYVNNMSLYRLIAFLKERLDTFNRKPTPAHLALAQLPISLVFTANFDDLLEQAYRQVGKRVRVVTREIDIPFMQTDVDIVNIVKLYGDLSQPDTIVLARQQYDAYLSERTHMIKLLEVELARKDMLYLGWSHTDPYFNFTFGKLLAHFGEYMRPGYAVMFDLPASRLQELQRRKLQVVQLPTGANRTEQITVWLDKLVPKPTKRTAKRATKPKKLQTVTSPYRWPSAYSQPRADTQEPVKTLLQQFGFEHHPFGPLQAEMDSDLPQFWYISPKYEMALIGARPALFFAEAGMGKTTYAFWLADSCTNPAIGSSAFPIYFACSAEELAACQSADHVLSLIGQQVGSQLIKFIALNPQTFLEHAASEKSAIVTALMASARERSNLLRRLTHNHLADEGLRRQIEAEIVRFHPQEQVGTYSNQEWREILSKARPKGFSATYFLLDIHNYVLAANNPKDSEQALALWMQQIVPLATVGLYLKSFLPSTLRSPLRQAAPADISEVALEWNRAELLEMLVDRLQWASNGRVSDFNQLFRLSDRRHPNPPVNRLIALAGTSSRRLIDVANRLFAQHTDHQAQHFTLSELESIG